MKILIFFPPSPILSPLLLFLLFSYSFSSFSLLLFFVLFSPLSSTILSSLFSLSLLLFSLFSPSRSIIWNPIISSQELCSQKYVHLHRNHLQRSLSKKKEIQQNGPWLDKPVKIKEESEIGRGKAVGFIAFTQRSNN